MTDKGKPLHVCPVFPRGRAQVNIIRLGKWSEEGVTQGKHLYCKFIQVSQETEYLQED